MPTETVRSSEAPACVLAMMIVANGYIDQRELQVLEDLDAFRRLGVSRDRFGELAKSYLDEIGASLCEKSWLGANDVLYLDHLLDEVLDPNERVLVCGLAAAVIAADGRITPDEQMVYSHAMARWHVSQSMASQVI